MRASLRICRLTDTHSCRPRPKYSRDQPTRSQTWGWRGEAVQRHSPGTSTSPSALPSTQGVVRPERERLFLEGCRGRGRAIEGGRWRVAVSVWFLYGAAAGISISESSDTPPGLPYSNNNSNRMTLEKMDPVEVFDAGEKGRGLRTTKTLVAGDVVFTEAAFAAVVFDNLTMQVCHNCFRRQASPHRCAQCKFAHYCDRTCQRAAWEEHKRECSAIKKTGKAPKENVRLVARAMWRMQKYGGKVIDTQLTTLDLLQDHVSDMVDEDVKELQDDVQKFLEYWPKTSRACGTEYISHLFGVIKVNGFTVSDQRGLQAVGVGLFPNLCLVNHDCWPNCTVILNHGNQSALDSSLHSQRRIELRALGPIKEGEELTVSYVDFLNLSQDRQKLLKKQYYFDCKCEHCSKGIKDDIMMASKDGEKKPSADQVKEVTEFSLKTLGKIEDARVIGDFEEVVKLCRECLQKQEGVVADTHLHHLRILSTASEVLSFMHSFKEAADCANRMVHGYEKLYHPNNAKLGMAIMRAGVTNWHAGSIEVGHAMICQAFAILLVTHGPHHPITKDLETMRSQTEMELKMFRQNEKAYQSMREAALHGKPLAEPVKEQV